MRVVSRGQFNSRIPEGALCTPESNLGREWRRQGALILLHNRTTPPAGRASPSTVFSRRTGQSASITKIDQIHLLS